LHSTGTHSENVTSTFLGPVIKQNYVLYML